MEIGADRGWRKRAWRFAALVALCLLAGASAAPAQDAGIPNFLQKLFGMPQERPAPAVPAPTPSPHKTHRSDYVPSTTTRAPGAPGGEPVQATFHIEVLGDSLAVLAADGLNEAFADKPEIGCHRQGARRIRSGSHGLFRLEQIRHRARGRD